MRSLPATRSRGAILLVVAAVALVGGLVAGLSYKRHADVWLRTPPAVPRCILRAREALRLGILVSGTEPHDDVNGNTVYLNEAEDSAVRCVSPISKDLAVHLTTAFTEIEPEPRALELLKVLRDYVPRDTPHDMEAILAYLAADAAIDALPKLPETKAASDELQLLHACRFSVHSPCPSRPPIPMRVWVAGVPSALAWLGLIVYGSTLGIGRLVAWIKRRRARKRA